MTGLSPPDANDGVSPSKKPVETVASSDVGEEDPEAVIDDPAMRDALRREALHAASRDVTPPLPSTPAPTAD